MSNIHNIKYLIVLLLLINQVVSAAPIHDHCDTKSWSRTSFNTNPRTSGTLTPEEIAILDYRNNEINFFGFRVPLNFNPPPSSVPNCHYEISDINSIDITFTFDFGPMILENLLINEFSPSGNRTLHFENGPRNFISGEASLFRFASHQGEATGLRNVMELVFPSGELAVLYNGDNAAFRITSAQIDVRGTHYYVPEPSTIILMITGIGLVYFRRKKNKMGSGSEVSPRIIARCEASAWAEWVARDGADRG